MRKSALLALIISFVFLFSCEGNVPDQKEISISPDSVEEVFPADDSIPEDVIIRLNRTVCFGKCPAYLLTVKADGQVNFFGQDHTKTKGQAKDKISKEKVKQLLTEFKNAKFFELNDNYNSTNCSKDNPTIRTTLFINKKVKKIEHDLGCDAPQELTNLENQIDEIVGTEKWIGNSNKGGTSKDENYK